MPKTSKPSSQFSKSWVLKRLTLKQPRKTVSQNHLWPPLELVEAAIDGHHALANDGSHARQRAAGHKPSTLASAAAQQQAAHLLLPLTELLERRAAVAAKAYSSDWKPGRVVQITHSGAVVGVLLDHQVQDKRWMGWLVASESSWASAFDVLLEPEDEPFEPLFGVVQTWNPLVLEQSDTIQAQVVAELSTARLASMKAVAQECAAGLMLNIPVEPGRIALRTAGGMFMVLTGTPLGPRDPRSEYQSAYLAVTARLIAQQLTHRASTIPKSLAPDANFSPANTLVDFRAKLKPGVRMHDVQQLLRVTFSYVVSGPDENNIYAVKSSNPEVAKAMFTQSILIAQVYEI
jgi:hypothetical protein